MGWNNLEAAKPDPEAAQAQKQRDAEERKALEAAARRAFADKQQTPLKDELVKVGRRPSFTPGRSAEEVAYLEGYRKLALDLLKMGGIHE